MYLFKCDFFSKAVLKFGFSGNGRAVGCCKAQNGIFLDFVGAVQELNFVLRFVRDILKLVLRFLEF